jgi:mono/diheme cytochrome c family protein
VVDAVAINRPELHNREGITVADQRMVAGLILSAALMLPAADVIAEDIAKVTAGRVLAKGWCAHCHIVSEDQRLAPAAGVPTFFAVANDPAMTELALRVFLATPHMRMPDFMMTRDDTDKIIAYILSLRRN